MNFVDRNQRIPLRGLNDVARKANQSAMPSGAGVDVQMIGAIPIYSPSPVNQRYCTARITGLAVDGEGDPILDDNGNQQYTWIEEERYIDGGGYPAWRDATFDGWRGSRQDGTGVYFHLAHEANGATATANDHVIMYAGIQNYKTTPADAQGFEHVFYQPQSGTASIPTGSWNALASTQKFDMVATVDIIFIGGDPTDAYFDFTAGAVTILQAGRYSFQANYSATPNGFIISQPETAVDFYFHLKVSGTDIDYQVSHVHFVGGVADGHVTCQGIIEVNNVDVPALVQVQVELFSDLSGDSLAIGIWNAKLDIIKLG